jgi:glycosyltransferase involved in cell wall biosynthesis
MRILHLAYRDTSGVPGRWADAHRAAGHEVRLIIELPHPFVYGTRGKIVRWSDRTLGPEWTRPIEADLEWADAIMAYEHPYYLKAALGTEKPVLYRTFGQSARDNHLEIKRLLRSSAVVRATVGLPDLAMLLGLELVGAPYKLLEPADPTALVLCHSPSDRMSKGTETVLRAARDTPWAVDLLEREKNYVVMKHKRRAALIVDSFNEHGYGVNAIEAMALGLPAVAWGTPEVRDYWRRLGSPVVFVDDEQDLHATLLRLAEDVELRDRLGAKGRDWVTRFHSAEARASEDLAALGDRAMVAA